MKLYIIDNKSPSSTFVGMGPTVVIVYKTESILSFFFFPEKLIDYTHTDNGRRRPTLSSNIRLRFLTFSIISDIIFFFVFFGGSVWRKNTNRERKIEKEKKTFSFCSFILFVCIRKELAACLVVTVIPGISKFTLAQLYFSSSYLLYNSVLRIDHLL